jgi:Xaa-Pro aminopeptidase
MHEIYQQRIATLRGLLQAHEADALLITSPANRRYISGFRGSSGALLITNTHTILISDFRYRTQASIESPSFTLREVNTEWPLPKLATAIASECGVQQLAFEAPHTPYSRYQELLDHANEQSRQTGHPLSLVPMGNVVERLRAVKSEDELQTLRHAIAITDSALQEVIRTISPDTTEKQVALKLEMAMRERGAEGVAFPIIVAAGPNSALPHAQPGDNPLGIGRPIVVDMGALYEGYHADMTRTFIISNGGEPDTQSDAQFEEVYQTVLNAQQAATAAIRPGMTGVEADEIARKVIADAGYGEAFGHGLGHSVGLEIHEDPRLSPSGEEPLQVGNVFSIEPGIYLESWGGVRIEDLVVLREHGCEVLTQSPKDPVLVPTNLGS